ncbi:hypothetical protein HD806DRAFT_82550 [Xylariaceae sp. AK1471]|nr:hypothetical protein HD806DRAFT_82550 [Xylariaceae sp. AK1471]
MTTDQQAKTFTVPVNTRLSHGIELEFLVAYLHRSDTDPDEANASTLPPILRVDTKNEDVAEEVIQKHIRTTLRDHSIRVREPTTNLVTATGGQNLDEWDVGSDITVTEGTAESELVKDKGSAYKWVGVELRSPARWDGPRAHEETRFVVNLLSSKYRLRANLSCGFHVHVGNGARYFDAKTLKRVGAFLLAADPILSRLHAPWRRVGSHSTSIRYRSRLACWEGVESTDADMIVRQVTNDVKAESHGHHILDAIPIVPWSDRSREEKDFGGEAGWRQYASNCVKEGPYITLHEKPSSTMKKRDDDGGAYYRRFREFMWTPSFRALCRNGYGHDNPDALTVEEQYILLAIAQCEILFGHVNFGKLSNSELHQITVACGPYIEIGRSGWEWDARQNMFTLRDSLVGVQLHHPLPLAYNELNAERFIDSLDALALQQDKREQDELMGDVEYENLSWDSSSNDSGGSFRPAAWAAVQKEQSHDNGISPGEFRSQSPAKTRISRSRNNTERVNEVDSDSAPSSPLRSQIISPHPPGDKDGNNINTTKKLRPHDVSQLTQSYMDKIESAQSLTMYDWKRIPFLPGPRQEGPDPGESHDRLGQSCRGRRCSGHAVTGTRPGLATLLGVQSGAAVGALLCDASDDPPQRLNYNFKAYAPETLGEGGESFAPKRTLEFREAGGSLEAEWIDTWARICVGIVRFCRDASAVDFIDILERIAGEEDRKRMSKRKGRMEHDDEVYDVCDLLEDICLFSEASTVRKREKRFGPPR